MFGDEDDTRKKMSFNSDNENIGNKENISEEDVMKILVASDIHLGYEQTTKRGAYIVLAGAQDDDSFQTFEEILEYARDQDVDLVLLGGDLFHEAKPPHNVIMRCINLLRKYCLSDKPVKIQFLTSPEAVFGHCFHQRVNYEDPNINVGMPIFSINGNHDDPSFGAVGSMDVLSATGLINYFGKWTDVTNVSIPPLYLRKGITTVALYGLGYMNDQRLSRLIRNDKFELLQSNKIKNPFNILVLHQNRSQHGQNSFVPEDRLPKFLNLVLWGHEHECVIAPKESNSNSGIFISQPGSSVATSLTYGESKPKNIGILSIYKNSFKMEALPLKTVRVFVFEDLILNEHCDEITKYKCRSEAVEEFVDTYIENILMDQAAKQQSGHLKQPAKPLIRLRIFYSEDRDVFDTLKLSQKYYNEVANPNDMILFKKCSSKLKKKDIKSTVGGLEEFGEIFKFDNSENDWKRTVIGGMTDYFNQDDKINKLTVLSLPCLNDALLKFVNANDSKAFEELVNHKIQTTLDLLVQENFNNTDEMLEAVKNHQNSRKEQQNDKNKVNNSVLENKNATTPQMINLSSKDDNDNNEANDIPPSARGRGHVRGRGRSASTKIETVTRAPRKRSIAKIPALDITMDKDNDRQSISLWRKPFQSSSRRETKQLIDIDLDSE